MANLRRPAPPDPRRNGAVLVSTGDTFPAGMLPCVDVTLEPGQTTAGAAAEASRRVAWTRHGTGTPARPQASIPGSLADALGKDIALTSAAWDPAAVGAALDRVAADADRLAALGLPETLVHGDFHPGNVTLVGDRPVIYDWSDAAMGWPMLDAGTWLAWVDDEARADAAWSTWLGAWSDLVDPRRLDAERPSILPLGAAYQVLTYSRSSTPSNQDSATRSGTGSTTI